MSVLLYLLYFYPSRDFPWKIYDTFEYSALKEGMDLFLFSTSCFDRCQAVWNFPLNLPFWCQFIAGGLTIWKCCHCPQGRIGVDINMTPYPSLSHVDFMFHKDTLLQGFPFRRNSICSGWLSPSLLVEVLSVALLYKHSTVRTHPIRYSSSVRKLFFNRRNTS